MGASHCIPPEPRKLQVMRTSLRAERLAHPRKWAADMHASTHVSLTGERYYHTQTQSNQSLFTGHLRVTAGVADEPGRNDGKRLQRHVTKDAEERMTSPLTDRMRAAGAMAAP